MTEWMECPKTGECKLTDCPHFKNPHRKVDGCNASCHGTVCVPYRLRVNDWVKILKRTTKCGNQGFPYPVEVCGLRIEQKVRLFRKDVCNYCKETIFSLENFFYFHESDLEYLPPEETVIFTAPETGTYRSGWNMTAPAMQQNWQAQLGQSQLGYQNLQQERATDYQLAQQQAGYTGQQQAGYAGQQNIMKVAVPTYRWTGKPLTWLNIANESNASISDLFRIITWFDNQRFVLLKKETIDFNDGFINYATKHDCFREFLLENGYIEEVRPEWLLG